MTEEDFWYPSSGHQWQAPPIAAQPGANAFFGKKRANTVGANLRARPLIGRHTGLPLQKHREAGEFLPAPKKVFARGKPQAKLHGPVLLVLFLPPRKVHG